MIKANFSAYSKYVTDSLNQWDLNRVLEVTGLNLTSAPEVHFSNANVDRAIVRQSTMENHVVRVNIPNSLLQDPLRIYAHIGIYEGDTFKVVELVEIPVTARKRPLDYQIDAGDDEVYSFKRLENLLADKATKDQVANIVAGVGSDAELVDVRYGADGVTYASAGEAVREQVEGLVTEIGTVETLERRNLITEYRMFHWSGGELSTLDTARHTQPIFLRKGEVVYGTNVYGKYGKLSDGFLTDKDGLSLLSPKVTVSPAEKNLNVEYFTFDPIPVTGFWTFNTVEGACITKDPAHINAGPGVYVPNEAVNVVFSNLVGKSVTFNGDSICSGAGFAGGYGRIIADRFGMTYENAAQNGGTIAAKTYKESTGEERYWICRSIESMNADADYAILEGGVNDASLGVPLGAISEGYNSTLDDTTFYGAFESMLKQLVTRFAGKKYGYIAVHQMANNFRIINDAETSYYWAAKKCCEKWGVPFLDLNGTVPPFNFFSAAGNPDLYALRTTYTDGGDGWHPNEACYKVYYVPKIINWMETI